MVVVIVGEQNTTITKQQQKKVPRTGYAVDMQARTASSKWIEKKKT